MAVGLAAADGARRNRGQPRADARLQQAESHGAGLCDCPGPLWRAVPEHDDVIGGSAGGERVDRRARARAELRLEYSLADRDRSPMNPGGRLTAEVRHEESMRRAVSVARPDGVRRNGDNPPVAYADDEPESDCVLVRRGPLGGEPAGRDGHTS